MPVISVQDVSKLYRIPQKDPGLAGAVKALLRPRYQEKVAVDRISLVIEPGEIGAVFGQRTQLWWDLALIESYNDEAGGRCLRLLDHGWLSAQLRAPAHA